MQVYLLFTYATFDERGTPVPEDEECKVNHEIRWARDEYECILKLEEMMQPPDRFRHQAHPHQTRLVQNEDVGDSAD